MSKPDSIALAVLPFSNLSADEENNYFCDGLTEEIINALAKIPGLRVTSRTSTFYFKDKDLPLSEIAEALNVSLILEGSVRLSGDQMRITAQLIESVEDFHFWSATWDRPRRDIFDVQDEISLEIADRIRESNGHFEVQSHLVKSQTDNLQTYEWYLKGRYHFRFWNPRDSQLAIECYDKALALDELHVESMLGKADALGFLATTGYMDQGEAWAEAAQLIYKAIEIDENQPEAHYQLSNLLFFTQADYKGALQATLRANELNPNFATAKQHLAFLYLIAGENQKAQPFIDRALQLDPLGQETRFYAAYSLYMNHQFTQALEALDSLLEDFGDNVPAHSIRGYLWIKLGLFDKIDGYFASLPEEIVVKEDQVGLEALVSIITGIDSVKKQSVEQLEELAKKPEGFRANSFLVFAYTLAGDFNKALNWIKTEMEIGNPFLMIHFSDPIIDDLKSEPRYLEYKKTLFPPSSEEQKIKRTKDLLSKSDSQTKHQELIKLMEEDLLYLDPDFSLSRLAGILDLNSNQTSWLINEVLKVNFNQFVNEFRIEEFKKRSILPENQHLSLMGIAYECGFNSKSVFNTYFKKQVGTTPSKWLATHQNK